MCPDACLLGDSRSHEVDNQDKPSQKYIQLQNKQSMRETQTTWFEISLLKVM